MLFALCLMTGVLSSCGKDTSSTETTKKDDNTLVILNYGKYIDESVLDQFEKETGIKVKLEEYESPEEMYTKFSAGSINYDLVCTSDYMVERLINEDQVLEINFDDFEYYKNLDSSIIEASQIFDPENKYSMPYFYGTLGILYNTTMVSDEEVSTWNVLWDEAYKDSIIMQNSVRDSFTPALRLSGYDINTTDENQLNDALDLLIRQKPLVYAYYVDETGDEMAMGNAATGIKLRDKINEVTDALKDAEEETQRYYRNVGNYKEAIMEAANANIPFVQQINVMVTSLGGVKNYISNVNQKLITVAKTTTGLTRVVKLLGTAMLGLGIGALLVVLASLVSWFTKTQKGVEAANKIMGALGATVNVLIDRAGKLGISLP